eukprot:Em0010g196a
MQPLVERLFLAVMLGTAPLRVYGFFATDGGKLLRNASVSEGRGREGPTFYFGVLKGLPPSIRKVRFKTNAGQEAVISNAESKKYDIVPVTWPYLTPQCVRFPVTMHRVSSNVTLEGNDVIWINPQLSSTGENEFVVPLHVAIVNTNGIVVGFTVSEMNVTAKHSIEICVNVTHPLPGMEPITMTISSAPRSDNKSMVTLSESSDNKSMVTLSESSDNKSMVTLSESSDNKSMVTLSESRPVSCIQRRDTPHAGLVTYSLSSKDTRQPLDIFPDMLTVTVT